MLWIKAFHVVAVVSWYAGLLYLPRLFVHHALTPASDQITLARFKIMERKLYVMMCIGGGATVTLGLFLASQLPTDKLLDATWLHIKVVLVSFLIAYHFYCGHLVKVFAADHNTRSHTWYRFFNEVPALFLIAIVILAVVKPF
ncbi:MAG: CopD family protein [Pseudomonadota bacterium]